MIRSSIPTAVVVAGMIILLLTAGCGHRPETTGRDSGLASSPSPAQRPQTPVPPFPYASEDVVYENAAAGVTLAGTLTLPAGEGPFPAAVLISGSGPQNRDCEVFGHRLFFVIADHLTRAGIAVLRVDDRGIGGSTSPGPIGDSTSFDFADDVRAGISFLRTRAEIRPDAIGLIGHSEGGMIGPIVADRDPTVAFVVMLAGPGIPIDQMLLLQDERGARADGMPTPDIETTSRIQRQVFDILLENPTVDDDARRRLRRLLMDSPAMPSDTADAKLAAIDDLIARISTKWFATFLRHDPQPVLRRLQCPVLAINGELDLQVTWPENLDGVAGALALGDNPDATTISFPGLNHPLQHCRTGRVAEYADIEETIAPEVLDLVTVWILDRFAGTGEGSMPVPRRRSAASDQRTSRMPA